ncbi:glycosyltransferase family A protein [Elizabethkingia anophelis]|uniref:glycosyltransferase family 2 protein n=1 Tax=Elizabethkingia anophelis TaxID=1117645 RepID=UPI00320A28C6
MNNSPKITVIMPTYNQVYFLPRAIHSLEQQTFKDWELIIVNDGSTDDTEIIIKQLEEPSKIKQYSLSQNLGIGAAINIGIEKSSSDIIAYLPSDDIYYEDHLQNLYDCLSDGSVMAYSGMLANYNDTPWGHGGNIKFGETEELQLVQVAHRKMEFKWIERRVLVSNSYKKLYWNNFLQLGAVKCTGKVTCEWISHPHQHHRLILEAHSGSIYKYKKYYKISEPLNVETSTQKINEHEFYKDFRKNDFPTNPKSLKILIIGELAYNSERIFALEEYGHKLYALWIENPSFYNAIGPLPFGNIENIPIHNWKKRVLEIKPDIIYALLNHQSIPLVHHVLSSGLGIPFVWHFKEGPFYARQHGMWNHLMEIYIHCNGAIFINDLMRQWFSNFLTLDYPTFILDGDLPKKNWFAQKSSKLLSDIDGEIHTVVPGRPMGIDNVLLEHLSAQKVHIHLYGDFYHSSWKNWVADAQHSAKGFVHLHPQCSANQWAEEFTKYDAGWLHCFTSSNYGEMQRMTWNDLNIPARLTTLAAAGLPIIQKDNSGHWVATQTLAEESGVGIFINNNSRDFLLENIKKARECMWRKRFEFSFDHHVNDLTDFFLNVINEYSKR